MCTYMVVPVGIYGTFIIIHIITALNNHHIHLIIALYMYMTLSPLNRDIVIIQMYEDYVMTR